MTRRRYQLLSRIGIGGMGEVYLARERSVANIERLVVIKRILREVAERKKAIRMFLDEARITMSLHHPNIATVYDLVEQDGEYLLVMEFVRGIDLWELIVKSQDRIPPALIAFVISKAAAALHHAHQTTDVRGKPLGIVHRDISPHNIRIGVDGMVKLIDFGVAKAIDNMDKTKVGTVKGKPAYMSPEQVKGVEADARSDVFSLGIVFFEMLTGRRLFRRKDATATLRAVLRAEIPRPSRYRKGIEELEGILLKALACDPNDRYADARELQRDLEAYLLDNPANEAALESYLKQVSDESEQNTLALAPDLITRTDTLDKLIASSLDTVIADSQETVIANSPKTVIADSLKTVIAGSLEKIAPTRCHTASSLTDRMMMPLYRRPFWVTAAVSLMIGGTGVLMALQNAL